MRAAGLVRVSTVEQGESGLSLTAQRAAIAGECERRGWELVEIAQETISTRAKRRPVREALLEKLDAGELDLLVVSRLDRVSRSTLDFALVCDRAEKHGWKVVLLDPRVDMTDPYGKAFAGVAAIFAELERSLIAQRTKEGIAAKVADGGRHGAKRQIPEETARIIVATRKAGKSLREIARLLNLEGVPTVNGRPWHHGVVRQVLIREGAL